MKKVLTARWGMMLLTLIAVSIIGCGGDEFEEEVPESSAMGIMGAMKVPDAVAAAPQAPGIGVPFVKGIRYFLDWKLTKEVQKSVSVGDTIFVKVMFSEAMKHVVADDKRARPILYYRRAEKGEELIRFRMATRGAGGKAFVSGDAKPLQGGTHNYICKYTVAPEDAGKQVAFMVGKSSVDLENNPLAQFYTHAKKLRVESTTPTKPETPEPTAVDPLTITTITHYRDRSDALIAEGESVEEGTTIRTEIVFAKPVRTDGLVITYPVPSGRKQLRHSTGVHWRGTYQLSRNGKTVRTKLNASGEIFSLVVEAAIGHDGSILKQSVAAPEIPVTPKAQPIAPEPYEPAVSAPQEPIIPDNVEQRAMQIAKKVSRARIEVSAKASYERHVNFSKDWEKALSVIAAEEKVPELTNDLVKDLYLIYIRNTQHPMTSYVRSDKQYAPSLILAYFRLRFLSPRDTREAILDRFKTGVQNSTIKVFLL